MISKQTAERIDEIDFETIINNNGLINHIALHAQNLKGDKRHKFFASAAAYYCHLTGIEPNIKELNKDICLVAWINACLADTGDLNTNLLIMLAGIYQFLEWENEKIL